MDAGRSGGDRGRRGGAAQRARPRLLRGRQPRRGPRGAGADVAGGRRARHPAPPDRRRGSDTASLPERASVAWRAPMDERRLRVYARSWTATTLFHTVPMVLVAGALLT